jgi:hypothetical protein
MNRLHSVVLASVLAFAPAPSAANLVVNGSFEADDASNIPFFLRQIPNGWSSIPGYDVVDVIHNDYTQNDPIPVLLDAQHGVQFIDLNGGDLIGGMQQTINGITPGARLLLSLYAGQWVTNSTLNGQPASLSYSLIDASNDTLLGTGNFTTDTALWTLRTLNAFAPVSGSVRVDIRTTFTLQAGPGVDNVSLVEVVPEPASWAMLVAGFGIVGAAMRRRRPAAAQA